MRRNKHIPAHFGTNAARTAQTRYLRGKTPESERVEKNREAAGHVISLCFMVALHDRYGIGKDRLPMGHGEKSVYLVMKFMDLTDEEALAIRWHMGAYDDAFRGGSRALNEAQDKCALVLALHHADMQATQEEKRREGIL